ncbi:MAG: hypothetical protein C0418_01995 [Coriobacteriaceae bacterium]|nr:hypothetical protein [Coriobacteriaceae bacterium]
MGAPEIAHALGTSRRAVRLYPPEHPSHREAIDDLVAAVTGAVDMRPLALNLSNGRLYEGSEVITDVTSALRSLAEAMETRRVESLTFHSGFSAVDATGLSEVLGLRPSPDLQISEELESRDVRAVTVSELEDNLSREAEERDRRREADRAMYRMSLSALKEVTSALAEGAPVERAKAVRAIGSLLERVSESPDAIVALAAMTGHGERWGFHAVSVMLHSLVLGHMLGLEDHQLFALGLAGLLHDAGSQLPPATDAEMDRSTHPIVGAFALGVVPDEDCAAIIVAYEHHMGVDGSGWPERETGYVTHPFTRIVAIADRYDDLTRPDTGPSLRPDQAMAQILREAGGGPLDPILARMFGQMLGVLPIGSVVRLSDHTIGVVRAPGEDPLRPQIRLVLATDGTELRPAVDVDLREDERRVVDVIAADLVGLQPSDYL